MPPLRYEQIVRTGGIHSTGCLDHDALKAEMVHYVCG
eukprot:CAMPEP_0173254300 /NCGR_PEP_ID=MMETSP1142-20121109/21842_1 /TAXON_ID=483371 /ORGANISM="non described non described, Strain CCMP2298" /LENGTH=36 /DNA_ID= /DNA_START= /DNA_END= /DNA_ORIENTATION=